MNTSISRFCALILLLSGIFIPATTFAAEKEPEQQRQKRFELALQKQNISPACLDETIYYKEKTTDKTKKEVTGSEVGDKTTDKNLATVERAAVEQCALKGYFLPKEEYTVNGVDNPIVPENSTIIRNHFTAPYLCPQAHPETFVLEDTATIEKLKKLRKDKELDTTKALVLNKRFINKDTNKLYPPNVVAKPAFSDIAKLKHYKMCILQREHYIKTGDGTNNPSLEKQLETAEDELQKGNEAVKDLKEEKELAEKLRQTALRAVDKAKAKDDFYEDKKYKEEVKKLGGKETNSSSTGEFTEAYWNQEAKLLQDFIVKKSNEIDNKVIGNGNTTYFHVKWEAMYMRSVMATYRLEIQALNKQVLTIQTSTIDIDGISIGNENQLTLIDGLSGSSNGDSKSTNLIEGVTKFILQIVGTLGVLLIVIAGFIMVTSNGDDAQITKGKNIIKATAIGLVIAFLSYTIVQFVIGLLFNA